MPPVAEDVAAQVPDFPPGTRAKALLASSRVPNVTGRLFFGVTVFASSRFFSARDLIYPVIGVVLAWWIFGHEMLPLLFPLASGIPLIGPFVAVGLYEMSRRREQGLRITWIDAFGAIRSPGFGAILVLGLVLLAILLLWLLAANVPTWSPKR